MENYVKEEVTDLEGDEDTFKHKKNLVKEKRIIPDSIKKTLIPHASSLKTSKDMFNALINMYEGNNIIKKMTLRTQLKGVKM